MLTPDVEKYIATQFENKLTSEDVIEDLVAGGWRETDAKAVVRQYETKMALDEASPKVSPEGPPKKKTQSVDFAKVDSHEGQADVAVGENLAAEDSTYEPPKIHQETEEKSISVQEQKNASQKEKQEKAEALLSSKVDEDSSYDELTMKMPLTHDQETDGQNQSNTHGELKTDFSPLDLKPQREKEDELSEKTETAQPVVSKGSPKRKRIFVTLALVWLLVIGVVIFLYIIFIQPEPPRGTQISLTPPPAGLPGGGLPPVNTTCGDDINCFVEEGSKCLRPVSVNKLKVNSFFASQQQVSTLMRVVPQPGDACLFGGKIMSVRTEFTGDIAEDTQRNVQLEDQEFVGLEGFCVVPQAEMEGFLEKVRDSDLSDLDILSAKCEGPYFEQDSIVF